MSWNTKHVEANNCNVRHVREKNNEVDLMFHLITCSSSSTKFSHTSFAASTFEIAPRTDRTAQPAPGSNMTGGKLHTTHHTFAKNIWQGQTQMKQRTLLNQREKKNFLQCFLKWILHCSSTTLFRPNTSANWAFAGWIGGTTASIFCTSFF